MPNTLAPGHVPAPAGTLCGFNYYGRTCAGGPDHTPAPAVHTLTDTLPVARAGTSLCAYHSPYDVLSRWDVRLSPAKGADVLTFVWARTRREAMNRVLNMMDADGGMWHGWSYALADHPTPDMHA